MIKCWRDLSGYGCRSGTFDRPRCRVVVSNVLGGFPRLLKIVDGGPHLAVDDAVSPANEHHNSGRLDRSKFSDNGVSAITPRSTTNPLHPSCIQCLNVNES